MGAAGIPLLAPGAVFKFSFLDLFSRLSVSARNDCYTVRLGLLQREKSNNFSRRGRGTAEERLTVNAREVFHNVRS